MDTLDMIDVDEISVGRVIAIAASQIVAILDPSTGASPPAAPLEMGSLAKIHTRGSTIYGMVNAMRVPMPNIANPDRDSQIIEMELVGETLRNPDGSWEPFRRGISIFPALGDGVLMAGRDDLARVYARPSVATAPIGTIHQDSRVPAYMLIDDLLGKHFSIIGTTGSGKSCAVSVILHGVIERNPNAHIMLIDPHNEYTKAFGAAANVLTTTSGLNLPYWLFNFEEIVEVLIGQVADRSEQVKILADAILIAKKPFLEKLGLDKVGTVDTPVPYRMSDVVKHLEAAMGRLERVENIASYQALKRRIASLQSDGRYGFVFGGILSLRDDMGEILSRLFRIPVEGKPLTILDVSAIPSEVLNVVVSLLCRLTFDYALWSETATPITIVCEEAHRYAPRDSRLGFEPAKRALSRIAKEGRKYGVSLCVVSQRPSDLATGLLSECNTIFALRMNNVDDQEIVRGAIAESSHGLLEFLPALGNGEAIAVGEGVSMPMRIRFKDLPIERRPRSANTSFSQAWLADLNGRSQMDRTIERWRRGQRLGP